MLKRKSNKKIFLLVSRKWGVSVTLRESSTFPVCAKDSTQDLVHTEQELYLSTHIANLKRNHFLNNSKVIINLNLEGERTLYISKHHCKLLNNFGTKCHKLMIPNMKLQVYPTHQRSTVFCNNGGK